MHVRYNQIFLSINRIIKDTTLKNPRKSTNCGYLCVHGAQITHFYKGHKMSFILENVKKPYSTTLQSFFIQIFVFKAFLVFTDIKVFHVKHISKCRQCYM